MEQTSFSCLSAPPPPKSSPPSIPPPNHISPPLRPPPSRQPTPSPPPPPPSPKFPSPPPALHPPGIPTLTPPPPQLSPPSSHTVIIIAFASLGGLFFLAFLAAGLCFMKKKKTKINESEAAIVEDHIHVHETIVQGQHNEQVVSISVDEDIKIQEAIKMDKLAVRGARIPRIVQDGEPAISSAQKPSSSS